MRKNLDARPAELSSNVSFNSKDKVFFHRILILISALFVFSLVELFEVDFFTLLDGLIAFFGNTPSH